jgi:hypothetical protein
MTIRVRTIRVFRRKFLMNNSAGAAHCDGAGSREAAITRLTIWGFSRRSLDAWDAELVGGVVSKYRIDASFGTVLVESIRACGTGG